MRAQIQYLAFRLNLKQCPQALSGDQLPDPPQKKLERVSLGTSGALPNSPCAFSAVYQPDAVPPATSLQWSAVLCCELHLGPTQAKPYRYFPPAPPTTSLPWLHKWMHFQPRNRLQRVHRYWEQGEQEQLWLTAPQAYLFWGEKCLVLSKYLTC